MFSHSVKPMPSRNHFCTFYDSAATQLQSAAAFIATGLQNQERCIYVADENPVGDVIREIGGRGVNVDEAVSSGALSVITKEDSYFKNGSFNPEKMFDFLEESYTAAMKQGYRRLRATGEMTWALQDESGIARLIEYESKCNHFYDRNNAIGVCQYNRMRFPGSLLRDIIYTHPKVADGNLVYDNQHYIPPEIFLAPKSDEAQFDFLLDTLRARYVAEENRNHAEGRLKKHTEELSRSNEQLAKFAHVAAHDLREPIRTVRIYLQLLERQLGELDPSANKYLSFVKDGALRMYDLVASLLDYSKLDTNSVGLNVTDCNQVLSEVVSDLKIAIDERKAVITWENLPTVVADRRQMHQLFLNLVSNGIKFNKGTCPLVKISVERMGGEWFFTVADNGIGIDAIYHERIFQVFQRLCRWNEYPGTGIGLSICKRIVERHGGRIWVTSEPGIGSAFQFTLLAAH